MRGSPEWYDRMFNNRALVPDFADHLQRWAKDSRQARDNANCLLDLSYGAGPNETLDIFPTDTTNAPVLVFLHGGYWRALDKSDHSFIAPAFTQKGICVVVPNYALCPAVSIADIVMQMVKALSWVWRYIHEWGGDPSRIHVAGHSAGGHLAAMLMACEWSRYATELPLNLVKSALAISGLFELASVRNSPMLQTDLRLDDTTVLQCSPAWMKAPVHASLRSVVGALESEEFLRHNALIRQAWGLERVPVSEALPDLHHFSMLSALVHPEHRLHHMASDMCLAS